MTKSNIEGIYQCKKMVVGGSGGRQKEPSVKILRSPFFAEALHVECNKTQNNIF